MLRLLDKTVDFFRFLLVGIFLYWAASYIEFWAIHDYLRPDPEGIRPVSAMLVFLVHVKPAIERLILPYRRRVLRLVRDEDHDDGF